MFLLQSLPHCQPADYEDWLRERGLEAFDAQDRVIRGAEPVWRPWRRREQSRTDRGSGDGSELDGVGRIPAARVSSWIPARGCSD